MILTAQGLRSIGWLALLAVCGALVMVLSFRVNALRSQVHRAEGQIVALKQQKMYLETEFETRANQQQLKAWNDLEFGYVAPTAGQYLENERQLASLSKPSEPDAPAPIRVASVDDSVIAEAAFPAMAGAHSSAVRPLSETHEAERVGHGTSDAASDRVAGTGLAGNALGSDGGAGKPRGGTLDQGGATLAEKLGTLRPAGARSADARSGDKAGPAKMGHDKTGTAKAGTAKTSHDKTSPARVAHDEKAEKHDKPAARSKATVEKANPKASRQADARTKAAKSAKPTKSGVKTSR